MSTNFYFRDKKEAQKVREANRKSQAKIQSIMEDVHSLFDDEEVHNQINNILTKESELQHHELHIGKRSLGWRPIFKVQPQFSTVRELQLFYNNHSEQYDIVDDSETLYTWEEFQENLLRWEPNGVESPDCSYKDAEGYQWFKEEFC